MKYFGSAKWSYTSLTRDLSVTATLQVEGCAARAYEAYQGNVLQNDFLYCGVRNGQKITLEVKMEGKFPVTLELVCDGVVRYVVPVFGINYTKKDKGRRGDDQKSLSDYVILDSAGTLKGSTLHIGDMRAREIPVNENNDDARTNSRYPVGSIIVRVYPVAYPYTTPPTPKSLPHFTDVQDWRQVTSPKDPTDVVKATHSVEVVPRKDSQLVKIGRKLEGFNFGNHSMSGVDPIDEMKFYIRDEDTLEYPTKITTRNLPGRQVIILDEGLDEDDDDNAPMFIDDDEDED